MAGVVNDLSIMALALNREARLFDPLFEMGASASSINIKSAVITARRSDLLGDDCGSIGWTSRPVMAAGLWSVSMIAG